jgi:hypothetical protein
VQRIRELIESLSDSGLESPYLDRLRARVRGRSDNQALAGLQQEILGEMAAALGRAETHVDEALLRCEVVGRRIDELERRRSTGEAVEGELSKAIDEFNAEREVAGRRLWELLVQREALGIRRHAMLERLYPIPPARRPPS